MQRRNPMLLVLSAMLLTGCAETPPDTPQITETDCSTEAAENSVSETVHTTEATADSVPEAENVLTFTVQEDGIDFLLDGVFFQTIAVEHVPDTKDIVICDYDDDGFQDVFLPDWPHSFRGHYYRYDEISGQLALWDALNSEEGGTGWYMEKNPDGTLLMNGDSIYGSTRTTYRWEQDMLIPGALLEHYWTDEGTVEDTYIYSDAQEKILVHRSITDDDGNPVRSIDDPLYFRITEEAVLVMKHTDIRQTLALGSFWESYAALGEYFRQQQLSPTVPLEGAFLREPECYLGTEDYDFDGHDDLYIPDTLQGACTGTYYRYEPEAGRYVTWDALNAIGYAMYADAETRTLHAYVGDEGQREKQSYAWTDGEIVILPEG